MRPLLLLLNVFAADLDPLCGDRFTIKHANCLDACFECALEVPQIVEHFTLSFSRAAIVQECFDKALGTGSPTGANAGRTSLFMKFTKRFFSASHIVSLLDWLR